MNDSKATEGPVTTDYAAANPIDFIARVLMYEDYAFDFWREPDAEAERAMYRVRATEAWAALVAKENPQDA